MDKSDPFGMRGHLKALLRHQLGYEPTEEEVTKYIENTEPRTQDLPLTESMQGITVGDIVSVAARRRVPFGAPYLQVHDEAVVIWINPMAGTAVVETPIKGTKRSYSQQTFNLYELTPIG